MDVSGFGGGLLFAAAAAVWLIYLMPTWFKRREYLSTERNAIRLQQTLRVLAETSEMPDAVRAETTARSAAAQERILREHHKSTAAADRARLAQAQAAIQARDARAAREVAERLAELAPELAPIMSGEAVRNQSARRIRRTRMTATFITAAGLLAIIAQVVVMAVTGVAAGAWVVLGFASIAAVAGLAALARMNSVARRRAVPAAPVAARPARRTVPDREPVAPVVETPVEEAEPITSWTPVPVPKPLYLGRPAIPKPVFVAADKLAEELRAAAAQAEEELRAAHAEPEVITMPQRPPSKFASMGIVEPIETSGVAGASIDDVLRRRRAAG